MTCRMLKSVRLKTVEALRERMVIFVLKGASVRQSVVLRQRPSIPRDTGQEFHATVRFIISKGVTGDD